MAAAAANGESDKDNDNSSPTYPTDPNVMAAFLHGCFDPTTQFSHNNTDYPAVIAAAAGKTITFYSHLLNAN